MEVTITLQTPTADSSIAPRHGREATYKYRKEIALYHLTTKYKV